MNPKQTIQTFRSTVDVGIRELIDALGKPCALRDAIAYSLLNGGKRIRPLIVLLISEALGKQYRVLPAALAVECFHSASLIADDLPCMDNEDKRRGKPCLHHLYPESVAILASYTLISLGYEYVHKNASLLPIGTAEQNVLAMQAIKTVTKAAGIFGATGGQFFDLFPPDQSRRTLEEITEKKTVTLFTISFVCGWLFGGGDIKRLPEVEALSRHLGRAFQLRDDLLDLEQDEEHGDNSNLAALLGKKAAKERVNQDIAAFRTLLEKLSIATPDMHYLADLLNVPEKRATLLLQE